MQLEDYNYNFPKKNRIYDKKFVSYLKNIENNLKNIIHQEKHTDLIRKCTICGSDESDIFYYKIIQNKFYCDICNKISKNIKKKNNI